MPLFTQRTERLSAGASEAEAFTNGVHYGLCFTLILAVLGFMIAWTLPKGKNAKAEAPQG